MRKHCKECGDTVFKITIEKEHIAILCTRCQTRQTYIKAKHLELILQCQNLEDIRQRLLKPQQSVSETTTECS